MWFVVERTALAEAEVEYADVESDMIWVKFPVTEGPDDLAGTFVVIWTTTPWTIPGNRAIAFSSRYAYGLYEVATAENDFGPQPGEKLIFAKRLADESAAKAKLTFNFVRDIEGSELAAVTCAHPLHGLGGGYAFKVPLLDGDHVTDDAGTGFVHTAPSHGREDFDAWMDNARALEARGISSAIPFTVDDAGYFTADAHGFGPDAEGGAGRVLDDKGKKGDANDRVIKALIARHALFARGRLKHSYPHSWRSKKPVIFRNTPQWFVYMDKAFGDGTTLRSRALSAIDDTRFVPGAGQNRLRAMIEGRPDWVLRASVPGACRSPSSPMTRARSSSTRPSTSASLKPSKRKAPTPGSPKAPRSVSSAPATTMPSGTRSWTFSTCGSIAVRHTPSRLRTVRT